MSEAIATAVEFRLQRLGWREAVELAALDHGVDTPSLRRALTADLRDVNGVSAQHHSELRRLGLSFLRPADNPNTAYAVGICA